MQIKSLELYIIRLFAMQDTTRQQLRQLQQELFEVRQQHQEQLRVAEVAREAAELRAMDIQKQQEIRSVLILGDDRW